MRYKLDYLSTPAPQAKLRRQKSRGGANFVTGIVILVGIMLFFGGLNTAFRFREQHQNLQQRHDVLRLRYDSLYAAKLQADKQMETVRRQLHSFKNKEMK